MGFNELGFKEDHCAKAVSGLGGCGLCSRLIDRAFEFDGSKS